MEVVNAFVDVFIEGLKMGNSSIRIRGKQHTCHWVSGTVTSVRNHYPSTQQGGWRQATLKVFLRHTDNTEGVYDIAFDAPCLQGHRLTLIWITERFTTSLVGVVNHNLDRYFYPVDDWKRRCSPPARGLMAFLMGAVIFVGTPMLAGAMIKIFGIGMIGAILLMIISLLIGLVASFAVPMQITGTYVDNAVQAVFKSEDWNNVLTRSRADYPS